MLHPTNLIASSLGAQDLPCETVEGVCCVTGQICACLPRAKAIIKTANDQSWYRAPASDFCGVDAYVALRHRPERMSHWWCDGKDFLELTIQDARNLILNGSPSVPWCGRVTTSKQKHGSIRAVTNDAPRGIWSFEELLVDCSDADRITRWWLVMSQALRDGIGKRMQSGEQVPLRTAAKLGADRILRFEKWAETKREYPLFRLLCFLLPTQAELKEAANREKKEREQCVLFE